MLATSRAASGSSSVSMGSFNVPIQVTEFVGHHFNLPDLSRPLSDEEVLEVEEILIGAKIKLTYRGYPKISTIKGVSIQKASQLKFPSEDGRELSIVQFIEERYKIKLKYPFLPALRIGCDARTKYLPMELCEIVQKRRYSIKLSDGQATQESLSYSKGSNVQMVRKVKNSGESCVNPEFGIQFADKPTLVEAQVLPPPRLKYHDTAGQVINVDPRQGYWETVNKGMIKGGLVKFWTCVNFSKSLPLVSVTHFCTDMVSICVTKGMVFMPKPLVPIQSCDPDRIEEALFDIHSQSTMELEGNGWQGEQLQLLIVVLPDASGSYGIIKRVCETKLGIISQCCMPTKVHNQPKQYLENLALKINVKVGGQNTVLFDNFPLISDHPTIIFGADVTHPNNRDGSSFSIAAVVASMDWPGVATYRGVYSEQGGGKEIMEDLYKLIQDPLTGEISPGGMVRELLLAFLKINKFKPERIIFYRDGVSQDQFLQVLTHEVTAIQKACSSIQEGYQPPITFVVGVKRHHMRFFPENEEGNISAGTIIDTQSCHPTGYDFYLNSHAVIEGTPRPTHYHVIHGENNFSANDLQTLTYNLCYTDARCARSTSLVPPVYYAHLTAHRARHYNEAMRGQHLSQIKENIKNVMFYC